MSKATYEYLYEEYIVKQKSWRAIAKELGMSLTWLFATAQKLGIKSRTKSEAQSLAITTKRHPHPTRGRKRTDEEIAKIGNSVIKYWQNAPNEVYVKKVLMAKAKWKEKNEKEKEKMSKNAALGLLKASREGSKLEKFLYKGLQSRGWEVQYHVSTMIDNQKMHLDLMVSELRVAIEIDGPSHYKNIWGQEHLEKMQSADNEKNGLLLRNGMKIIRVKCLYEDWSKVRGGQILDLVDNKLKEIKANPNKTYNIILLEIT